MTTEVKVPQTEAQFGLPFLVEMGLAKKCECCELAKELVLKLQRQAHGMTGLADVCTGDVATRTQEGRFSLKTLAVRCSECKDTGVVPTPKGWRLIGLVKMFIDQASGAELGREEEIPW